MGMLLIQQGCVQQSLGAGVVALWLALLALLALAIRQRWNAHGEWSRKLVHIGGGAVVPLAWLFGIERWLAIPAAAAITLLAWFNHRRRLLPAIEDVGRSSYGTVAYGASITLLLLLFWPWRPDAVCAGVLVMALGDGLAGLEVFSLRAAPKAKRLGIRLDKLADRYGSPSLTEIERFTRAFNAAASRSSAASNSTEWTDGQGDLRGWRPHGAGRAGAAAVRQARGAGGRRARGRCPRWAPCRPPRTPTRPSIAAPGR
jgi:hypothetical protein